MNNNNTSHNAFRIQNHVVVKQQSDSGLNANYQLAPPGGGGSSDGQAHGSTFWRDMLDLPTAVELKLEQNATNNTANHANHHVSNHVTNHVTSQQPSFANASMHNNGFMPAGVPPPLCQVPLPLVFAAPVPPPPQPESPPPPPRVYKPCSVCGDKSSGYHYGVCSCEGCKGFFRRSVQKCMEYVCHKDKQCVINKVTRNRCQYCRLHKCYAKGMSREAVRNDRHKRRRSKEAEACSSSTQACEEVRKEEEALIERVLQAHEETFPLVSGDDTFNNKEAGAGMLWEKVRELSTHGIIQIVQFGKQVPGFPSLSTCDQITLLKAACLEILILRLSSRYQEERGSMQFSGGLHLTADQLEAGGFGSLTPTIFTFARCMQQYELDTTEFAMLCAVCLLSGDRSGLESAGAVERLQEPLLEALKHYVRQRRPASTHSFAKMLMKLSDLRAISIKGAEKVLKLHSETSTELPPLIVEMLDRAENVSIPQ